MQHVDAPFGCSNGSGVRITGVAAEIPPTVVTTAEIEERAGLWERFHLEPGWLEHVTQVRERRWAAPDVTPSELAAAAGRKALDEAGVDPLEIDVVLFGGITHDFLEPATANVVADAVGAWKARVFDVANACNGLIDALDVADALIRSGRARRALVATGERASIVTNWQARTIEEFLPLVAGLMVGDGGGALVLEAADEPERGLRAREFRSNPAQWRLAVAGINRPTNQACEICGGIQDLRFATEGRRMFEVGIAMMPPTVSAVMERTGWSYEDLDIAFCHEAHRKFIDNGMAETRDKIWSTVERFGNTSTFSLPLAMAEARAAGALVPGKKVLLMAGGAGMSTAAMTLIW